MNGAEELGRKARSFVVPKRLAALALAAFALAALPYSTRAQKRAKPAPTKTAMPAASIVLPQKLIAGQRATLAVLDAAGRLAPDVTVEFGGSERVTTDATGRATFAAPMQTGVLLAHLPGLPISSSSTIIPSPANPPDGVQINDHPRFVSVSDRFSVGGFGFRGNADANRVTLADQAALVVAASPASLVLLPDPDTPVGPTQLLIEVGGRSPGPVPVTLVSLHVIGPQKQLGQGEKGKLIVRVRGTDQRLLVEARNLTPEIIELPAGNVQRVSSSGGAYNRAKIEMQGLKPGDFAISARLVHGAAGMPDVEAARQHLLAARKLAPRDWQPRVDLVLRHAERDPQDVLRIRDELEKMLAEKPEGEFGRQLEAAWRELLKR